MYKCDSCNVNVGPRISKSINSRVTEKQEKVYFVNKTRLLMMDGKPEKIQEQIAVTGWEIVKVTAFCPTEAKFWDEVHLTDESHFGTS